TTNSRSSISRLMLLSATLEPNRLVTLRIDKEDIVLDHSLLCSGIEQVNAIQVERKINAFVWRETHGRDGTGPKHHVTNLQCINCLVAERFNGHHTGLECTLLRTVSETGVFGPNAQHKIGLRLALADTLNQFSRQGQRKT